MSTPLKEPGYYVPWQIIKEYYQNKNTFFHSRADLLKRGMLKGYNNERYFGESSTFYTNGAYNITQKVLTDRGVDMDRIKIIYIIKHPLDRIKSHYLHVVRNRNYLGSIDQFIRENHETIDITLYGKHISGYSAYLKEDQIHLLTFEDLIRSPQTELNKIYQFLNLSSYQHKSFEIKNAAPEAQQELKENLTFSNDSLITIWNAIEEDRKRLQPFVEDLKLSW